MFSRSVLVLPDDNGQQIIDAIQAAQKSLRIKMFIFSDPDLIEATIAAKGRGVNVRVMLNPETGKAGRGGRRPEDHG